MLGVYRKPSVSEGSSKLMYILEIAISTQQNSIGATKDVQSKKVE